ncbi:hypothetical protein SRHO_G00040290 [Serrasalmus rhombeus]
MAACNFGRTLLSKSQMDDATGPTNTTQQTSSVTDDAMVAHDSRPSHLSKSQMDDATGPTNTTQQMARHLEHAHQDKSDVAKALSFPKGSKERKTHLNYIRNRGNYAHNAAVMESGKGKLEPFKRPPKEVQGNDFMHCAYCQGLFTRRVLWRHMCSCRLRPGSVAPKPGKNRVQSMCTYTGPVPSTISKQLWGVISAMNPDPVTDIVKNDQVIIDVGQHLLNKGGTSAKNQQSVREKMREMGRLIRNARKVTTLKKMEDLINPKKYMETVKAVKLTCGYDSETNKFLIPSLANKLGNTLVKVSKLLKAQGLISNNDKLVKNASEFQDVHQEKWNELISATALRNIREAKWNVPTLMPFTEDVQKMHAYLTQVQDEWYNSLSESPSTKAWMELAKVCLAQIILFNRRREGEVASMPLSAFSSRDTSDPHVEVDWALSEVEKKLCRHFSRIVIRGKRGRPVPILLTPKMLGALELLVKQREACGVLKDNGYMFARPEAMTHFRGSDCIRGFAKACGARCPESLTSTRLRKHAATLSTVLNMTDTEMDQLANFLGHDIRIHREFYRLPEKTLQLAKISKVLMALEQGRLAEFHGKNLDEIGIDPDEKILDSDEDTSVQEEKRSSSTSTVDEPSAEESLSPTKKNEMPPPPPKKYKPLSDEDETPSRFGAMRHSSKGKATQKKKRPWKQPEVQAVERHMNRFITACTVPAKSDCESSEGEGAATEMSGKRKHTWKQPQTKATVEDTAGKPPQDPPPLEKLKCFQDILDIVCGLSDEEWRALTSDAPHAISKAEFASLCTNIMISVGKSAVKSFLPTLIHTLGMEAVLTAEEQLRKRTQSESRSPSGQSTTPTKPAASSHDSDERSTVEPSAFICTMIEDFISEVKVAMQEAICKLASCKAFSKSWEPKQSAMAEEMPNVLSELFKKSEREDAPSTGRKMHKAKQETERDIADITGKIVVVVLDHMDGGSVDRTDLRTSDLLNAAAEKMKQIISSSEDSTNKRTLLEQSKRQNAEELQAKATRSVSPVLLESIVLEVNGGSPEMPSSLASEANLDSVFNVCKKAPVFSFGFRVSKNL